MIIGTFAPEGPERCSGLPVMRHNAESLVRVLGPEFVLETSRPHDHRTPWGSVQHFPVQQFPALRKATVTRQEGAERRPPVSGLAGDGLHGVGSAGRKAKGLQRHPDGHGDHHQVLGQRHEPERELLLPPTHAHFSSRLSM